ncbi:MAG: hypothetical protein ACREA3_03505, partial [Nitrosotalea sp.]
LMLHLEKIDNILASDKAIRYVGIIDSTGNIVASKSRGGGSVTDKDEIFRFDLRILKSVLDVENDIHGKTTCCITTREKIEQLVWYHDDLIIYVTCDPDLDRSKLLQISYKVQDLVRELVASLA